MKSKILLLKRVSSFALIILLFFIDPIFLSAHNFEEIIYLPQKEYKGISVAVNDLAFWLEKATGKHFEIKIGDPSEKGGIHLKLVKDLNLESDINKKINSKGQSFYLVINGSHSAQIIGTGENSLINGIYTFLQELGFRWYMPGDTWTIMPTSISKDLRINKVYTPDFQNRSYFGTGGVNAIPGTDPKNSFRHDYELWKRRNRFSTDYAIKGHSGHLFYNANKKILDAHPEWFCNGKINPYGRIDISQPEVVRLFTNWALSQVKPNDKFPTIGVDPSDGAGGKDDCLPTDMREIKSWSDKYFWLANQVAARLDEKDNTTQVQLYAYASHAAPPSFKLEKNVYPIIIPYAFQKVTSPGNFIKLWADKLDGRPMGIYDYWNITQWSSGVPQFNIYSIPEKLRLWKKYNVSYVALETTNGKGAMGPALWLASQMLWNTSQSFDVLYSDFLNNCFGPAAGDVKRMYDRWSKNYQEGMEVNLSLQDLAAASAKTRDKAVIKRLNELKAYVHYIKLFYDYQANPKSIELYDKLNQYIHSIHHLRLVQSSALLERYVKAPAGFKNAAISKPISPLSEKIIEEQFQQDLKNNIAYSIPDFSFDIKKVKPLVKEPAVTALHINGRNEYQFFMPEPGNFLIKAGTSMTNKLMITDTNGRTWLEKNITGAKEGYINVQVKLPAGIYNLSFGDFARFSRLVFPTDLVFVASGIPYYDNAGFPKHYVYVPKEAKEIIYEDKLGPGTNKRGYWLNPDGEKIKPVQLKNSVYRIQVPLKYRGKIWTFDVGHRSFKLLNIPNRFSIMKFIYNEN